jgi:hypothetical protein
MSLAATQLKYTSKILNTHCKERVKLVFLRGESFQQMQFELVAVTVAVTVNAIETKENTVLLFVALALISLRVEHIKALLSKSIYSSHGKKSSSLSFFALFREAFLGVDFTVVSLARSFERCVTGYVLILRVTTFASKSLLFEHFSGHF